MNYVLFVPTNRRSYYIFFLKKNHALIVLLMFVDGL